MCKKTTTIILIIIALVIGYVTGAIIGVPLSEGVISGDVGKASQLQNAIVKENNQEFLKKLRKDKDYKTKVEDLLSYIEVVTRNFSSNAILSVEACDTITSFDKFTSLMQVISKSSYEIYDNTQATLEIIKNINNNNCQNLELQYNRVITSYILLEANMPMINDFIQAIDEYSTNNKSSAKLLFAKNMWIDHMLLEDMSEDNEIKIFCAQENIRIISLQDELIN